MTEVAYNTLFEGLSPEDTNEVLGVVSRIVGKKRGASDRILQKAYYLACVESIEDRLTKLPSPRFFSWTYGPWSKQLREIMEAAEDTGAVEVDFGPSRYKPVTKVYKWPAKRELPPMKDPEDATFIEGFMHHVAKLPGDELTSLAKKTVPYLRTPSGHPIDLDGYLAERKLALESLSDDAMLAGILESRTR